MTNWFRAGALTAVSALVLVVAYGGPVPAAAAAAAVSIDTNATGNSATALGTREECNTIAASGSVNVDITVSSVDSIAGFEADVFYNGARVSVTSESSAFILMQPLIPPPLLFDLSDSVPDSDGDYNVLVSSTGNGSGSGVVVRLALQGVSAGESTLDLANVKMKDFNNLPVQPANAGGFYTGTINDGRLSVGAPCSPDTDGDGVGDAFDNCPAASNPAQANSDGDSLGDACDTEGPAGNTNGVSGSDDCLDGVDNDGDTLVDGPAEVTCVVNDSDGDGVSDAADNCPHWPNASQTLPVWSVPAGDSDCDGFPDTVTASGRGRENFIGTDATDHCADTTVLNDETAPGVSPWPPDFNDNRAANLSDVVMFGASFNQIGPNPPNALYNPRFDLNASNSVNLSDVVAIGPFFNKFCTP